MVKALTHGKYTNVIKRACKCEECLAAYNIYKKDYMARKRAQFASGELEVRHGTANGYFFGCRCNRCVQRARHRSRKPGKENDAQVYLTEQDDRCAICRVGGKLVYDHDHSTGNGRGMLCIKCNLGLGQFRDSAELLQRAQRYIINPNEVRLDHVVSFSEPY